MSIKSWNSRSSQTPFIEGKSIRSQMFSIVSKHDVLKFGGTKSVLGKGWQVIGVECSLEACEKITQEFGLSGFRASTGSTHSGIIGYDRHVIVLSSS